MLVSFFKCSFGAMVIELVCLTFEILARMDTVYVVGSARQVGSKVKMGDDENSEGKFNTIIIKPVCWFLCVCVCVCLSD